MLTYDDTRLAQMICEERIGKRREPISLERPRKPRQFRPVGEESLGSTPGVVRIIRSAVACGRAAAAFLI